MLSIEDVNLLINEMAWHINSRLDDFFLSGDRINFTIDSLDQALDQAPESVGYWVDDIEDMEKLLHLFRKLIVYRKDLDEAASKLED